MSEAQTLPAAETHRPTTDEFSPCAPSNRLMGAPAPTRIPIAVAVGGVPPDVAVVDALARLQLVARRHGCGVILRNASSELLELVSFMGLSEALPEGPYPVQPSTRR